MKNLIAGLTLLAGFTSPAYAHSLSIHDGMVAFYHQLLGVHHLPLTALLVVIGVALLWSSRKRTD